ncbi:class A beta-lactamase, subclass A2 [Chitinophaga nivalis]|uniref:Beta-lactamase n=1 Tax=Chitinophaga nivalis TaxID=2991709 RepID=A0ABT3ITG9_9BACT|nr:class A beta-lactamase, subclass A2 [Chitinophaga nivalis]MCW3463037.1 class A beta-lactamase, subclass A2 [Chitinophaga nivalis]MCW3487273.1 class A beta-lactamase, subclass A2 [Chitinophaga nivalis]
MITAPRFIFTLLFSLFIATAFGQIHTLQQKIEQISTSKQATVGVAIAGPGKGDTLSILANKHFPMQSVFKFHIALAILNEVDKGKFSLNQPILIRKKDLRRGTWSPIREKYPNGNIQLPLAEILTYTVAESDNNGCDILLRLIGGTATVNRYIHGIGVKEVSIKANEAEAAKAWSVQFRNWTTPVAAVAALRRFYEGKILSEKSTAFLWQTMLGTATGKKRLKGQLPAGTLVAHKTGTSDTNAAGETAAINDIGVVMLPDGRYFYISVFVTAAKENTDTNEKIIADIAKAAWDYFTQQPL